MCFRCALKWRGYPPILCAWADSSLPLSEIASRLAILVRPIGHRQNVVLFAGTLGVCHDLWACILVLSPILRQAKDVRRDNGVLAVQQFGKCSWKSSRQHHRGICFSAKRKPKRSDCRSKRHNRTPDHCSCGEAVSTPCKLRAGSRKCDTRSTSVCAWFSSAAAAAAVSWTSVVLR